MARTGRPPKFNDERAQIVIDARRRGETYDKAAILAGVNVDTVMEWKKRYADFSEQVKKAESDHEKTYSDVLVSAAKRSLLDLISGFDANETKTEYENDAHGNPRIKKQINTTKHFPPNATAIIFALTNLAPDVWKNRQTTDVNATTKAEAEISLDKVPDELLAQVIDAIKK